MKTTLPPSPSDPKLKRSAVSIKTAAIMLEVSEKSIRRLIERGLLKPNRALRVLRIPVSQIEELLTSHG
jgi:hypothetical protein